MRFTGVVLVASSLGGCDQIFELTPPVEVEVDAAVDAALDAPASEPCPAFMPPTWTVASTEILGAEPAVSTATGEIVFARSGELYSANLNSEVLPAPLPGTINTAAIESSPALLPGGQRLYLARGSTGRIYQASRSSGTGWVLDGPVPGFLPDSHDYRPGSVTDPALGPRLVISYRASAASDSTFDLVEYRADAAGTYAAIDPPTLTAVNFVQVADRDPHLTPDGCWLFFSSNRSGEYRIYVATRPFLAEPFQTPQRVELGGVPGTDERSPWLDDSGVLWFTRGPEATSVIMTATR